MSSYSKLLKKRNNLWYEYRALSKSILDFNIPYHKARALYLERKIVYNKFIFYQKIIESIDKRNKNAQYF